MPPDNTRHVEETPVYDPTVDESQSLGRLEAERGGGCSAWVAGIITLIVAGLLIAVGLLLPPVNLLDRLSGEQYTPLSASAPEIGVEGLQIAAEGFPSETDFGVALNTMTLGESIATTDLPNHQVISNVFTVGTTGTSPSAFFLRLDSPDTANADLLDLYGWEETNSGTQYTFIPTAIEGNTLQARIETLPSRLALFAAQPAPMPTVLVSVDVTQTLSPAVAEAASIVAPGGLQPTLTGALTGSLAAGFTTNAAYQVMPIVRNFTDARATDADTVSAILSNATLLQTHAAQLAAFASNGYDGVLLDYRDLPPDRRDGMTLLVERTGDALTSASLGVVVPMPAWTEAGWDTGAYDWAALGAAADLFVIDLPNNPHLFDVERADSLAALLRYAVRQVAREKVLVTLSSLSAREDANGNLTPIGYAQALSALGNVIIEADTSDGGSIAPGQLFRARLDGFAPQQGVDENTGQPYLDYQDANDERAARMWLTTPAALASRMATITPFAIGGVAFDDLLAPGVAEGALAPIVSYKLGLPPASTGERNLALRWTISGAAGSTGQVMTSLNAPLIATVAGIEGNFAVNVAIVPTDLMSVVGTMEAPRAGAQVAVFNPTNTPTPVPTATLTPTPMPTNTPVRQEGAALPQSGVPADGGVSVAAANVPGPGSIVAGNFEYGGHVTAATTGAAEAMRRAGMVWMKVQLRYSPGMDGSAAQGPINDAHGRGFKILLGVVGSPGDLANGGAGYMQQFAGFLGSVAGYGPDAIEVWNEPNLDREWPEGQISGATYAQLLSLSYNAIKSANAGVMVISGAPAPTGAEAAYPGRVMNDNRWVGELVAAGGLNSMDCLGAHYNEGIVPPSAAGGDPRDNYYTRYFGGMVNTYWSLIGGQKPICFTEFGYLSPEGFGALPSYFAWAQNVTVAQQAAWLAEAAALSSQSGRVRMMIVWNVDFSLYDSDPQGGYAIVRPGGGCPACDALAGAR